MEREAQRQGRVGYSQQAGAAKFPMRLNLGSKGWYTKIKGWESGGQKRCRICVEKNVMHQPPRQYVFSLACVSLLPLPTMLFSACYSKSQHAIKDVTTQRLVGVCACVCAAGE